MTNLNDTIGKFKCCLYFIIFMQALILLIQMLVFCVLGRPYSFKEDDIYICEYRLDKTAHLFNPIGKNRYPVCTKNYAFERFEKKLQLKRDYSVSFTSIFMPVMS